MLVIIIFSQIYKIKLNQKLNFLRKNQK